MKRIPAFWTSDDIHYGQTRQMQRQLDLLAQFDIPGTFFLVPKWTDYTLDQDAELLALLKRAIADGHEMGQHGYVHTPFECGVPELRMLNFSPAVQDRFTTERFQIEAAHTLPALKLMLTNGQVIWKRTFGVRSRGFRPGWGAFCGNLYRALSALRYEWVSSRLGSLTSWVWNAGDLTFPDEPALIGYAPCRSLKMPEYPIAGDYGFHVKRKDIKKFAELGWAQFQACRQLGVPYNLVSHWHGLERNGDTGYAVHESLLRRIQKSGQAEWLTMSAYHDRRR